LCPVNFPVVTRVPFAARRDPELEPEAIRSGRARIQPAFRGSPQYEHEALSARAGTPVLVKVETVNPIRAFKGCGTWLGIEGPGRPARARLPAAGAATAAARCSSS